MKEILDFLFEIGQLKNTERSGWKLIDIENTESVAEHSYRAAIIGYFLAKKEGCEEAEVIKMLLFHDIYETRIGDIHKVAGRYLNKKEAEKKVLKEQAQLLPEELVEDYLELVNKFETGKSKEALIAKDADLIECAIQAKEYVNKGYVAAESWIENAGNAVTTETAKKLIKHIKNKEDSWWAGLKKLD